VPCARPRTAGVRRRLRRETDLPIEIISGLDEARLIFRAVRHAMQLEDGASPARRRWRQRRLTLVEDGRLVWMRSVPLGVARLSGASCRATADRPP
jgi:hypothetical protein